MMTDGSMSMEFGAGAAPAFFSDLDPSTGKCTCVYDVSISPAGFTCEAQCVVL